MGRWRKPNQKTFNIMWWGLMTVVANRRQIRYKPDGVEFFLLFHFSLLEVAKRAQKKISWKIMCEERWWCSLSLTHSLAPNNRIHRKNASSFQHKHFLNIVLVSGHCFSFLFICMTTYFIFFHALIFITEAWPHDDK